MHDITRYLRDRNHSGPLFRTRELALAAEGDVRVHFKGGIYRKLGNVLSAETRRPLALYEHLWPHNNQIFVRDDEEFEGMKNLGEEKGEVEWVVRFAKVPSLIADSTEPSATSRSSPTS